MVWFPILCQKPFSWNHAHGNGNGPSRLGRPQLMVCPFFFFLVHSRKDFFLGLRGTIVANLNCHTGHVKALRPWEPIGLFEEEMHLELVDIPGMLIHGSVTRWFKCFNCAFWRWKRVDLDSGCSQVRLRHSDLEWDFYHQWLIYTPEN